MAEETQGRNEGVRCYCPLLATSRIARLLSKKIEEARRASSSPLLTFLFFYSHFKREHKALAGLRVAVDLTAPWRASDL